jgi:methionyl-tRNA formyltransferase
MKKISKTIIFFGSGPVAAESLRQVSKDFVVEYVITKSRPEHHKYPAPVEVLAQELGIDVLHANSKQDVDQVLRDTEFESPIGLIIDFGVIVSDFAINRFEKGIINSHFSLLPKWRGADPITYCLLEGDTKTGVSLMKIVPKLDEGPLIAQESFELGNKINAVELKRILIDLSNSMINKYLPDFVSGSLKPKPQPDITPTYSHKIKKSDGVIDWVKSADRIEREIRAYAGWPKSRTQLGSIEVIITKASVTSSGDNSPGNLSILNDSSELLISCGQGSLLIERLQPAGKKEMSTAEFIRGYGAKLLGSS